MTNSQKTTIIAAPATIPNTGGTHGVFPAPGMWQIVGYTLVPLFALTVLVISVYFCVRRYQYGLLKSKQGLLAPGMPIAQVQMAKPAQFGPNGIIVPQTNQQQQMAATDHLLMIQPQIRPITAPTQLGQVTKLSLFAEGRFGSVWKGVVGATHQLVAIKVFPLCDSDSWVLEQEIFAVDAMKSHPNIVTFLGAQVRGCGPTTEYWLLTQFHANGSLNRHLRDHTLSVGQALHVATGTLRGLAYLHEECVTRDGVVTKPTIVHRDFKPANVLVGADCTAYIADFGLALLCSHGRTSDAHGHQVGTHRYMAPEVLERATEFSAFAFRQIDVYACSLVLWEIVSRTQLAGNSQCHFLDYSTPIE